MQFKFDMHENLEIAAEITETNIDAESSHIILSDEIFNTLIWICNPNNRFLTISQLFLNIQYTM